MHQRKDIEFSEEMIVHEDVQELESLQQSFAGEDKSCCFPCRQEAAVVLSLDAAEFRKATVVVCITGKKHIQQMRLQMRRQRQQQDDAFRQVHPVVMDDLAVERGIFRQIGLRYLMDRCI